ncbi:helix-turn-helix domain-containing protein [Hymenobacter sp. BT491]|uniref:helix-turn-helix domain-containing protein n=1 Tax=Hymenobacter sp. BT491 TaxID=2766779 RepID=UPI00165345B2|nr:helix-turn-helix transcriptional regulator [Hymenobacter sp. BT491]MBC6989945.1 AraC family transcriptional regulator [Hymenobacter sp. BT491]
MKTVTNLDSIRQYNALVGRETLHPLVGVHDFTTTPGGELPTSLNYGFYTVYLKTERVCNLRYGRSNYDYDAGTLVFIAPGQVVTVESESDTVQPIGHALLFHPDLLWGTSLAQHMKDYGFFSYEVHEALHLSDQERLIVLECFRKIDYELRHGVDKHSRKLIVSNIELFLNYCVRFYDRQFISREPTNAGIVEKFEQELNRYLASEQPQVEGIPSVAHFASLLHLSANYFGELIKKETGKTPLEYIQGKMLEVAKEKIFTPGKSVSEVAFELGFKYPQHFTRFFKQQVGRTPHQYRNSLN